MVVEVVVAAVVGECSKTLENIYPSQITSFHWSTTEESPVQWRCVCVCVNMVDSHVVKQTGCVTHTTSGESHNTLTHLFIPIYSKVKTVVVDVGCCSLSKNAPPEKISGSSCPLPPRRRLHPWYRWSTA
jgi:hypothetical protein